MLISLYPIAVSYKLSTWLTSWPVLDVTKSLHDTMEPFLVWMEKAERKQALAAPIASDVQTMKKQKDEQIQVTTTSLYSFLYIAALFNFLGFQILFWHLVILFNGPSKLEACWGGRN